MNKKDITEIKRRIKFETTTINKMCGCYVNAEKEKVLTFNEDFFNIEDEEKHKYVEIASKALSGKLGNNLLEFEFPLEASAEGEIQHSLLALRNTGLKEDAPVEAFYDHVIKNYDFVGNYLILLFHDIYDIPVKTTDGMKLDDSLEVYDYIICALVPVALSKPGLGYNKDKNCIAPLDRDWVVGNVDTAFTFPAFTDRSTDIHSILLYTKDTKEPHKEFWENGLSLTSRYTSTEKKNAFVNLIKDNAENENETPEDLILDIQESINNILEEQIELNGKDEPVVMAPEKINTILKDNGVSEDSIDKFTKKYDTFFEAELPNADELLDNRAIKQIEERAGKKALEKQIVNLSNELKESGLLDEDGKNIDIVLKVAPEKADKITSTHVNGKLCLLIPLESGEETSVNGEIIEF
ncbi:MAG: DUF4317 domain-containing protein [Lachnospiraceae bacterium]|nr:DUF4317 domain-containing protein [Lachnospiraceae bacterium]